MMQDLLALALCLAATTGLVAGARYNVRSCTAALYSYEKHTLFHNLVYHKLIGYHSARVYLDDRRSENQTEEEDRFIQQLETIEGVRVYRWSELKGVNVQWEMARHCVAEAEADPEVDWVTQRDGDEYMMDGPHVMLHRTTDRITFNISRWIQERVPGGVNHFLIPSLYVDNGPGFNGSNVVDHPPVEVLGWNFFEPFLYTHVPLPLQTRCPAKWFRRTRVGLPIPGPGAEHLVGRMGNFVLSRLPNMVESWYCSTLGIEQLRHEPPNFESYNDLLYMSYVTRSRSECEQKRANQAVGIDAVRQLGNTKPAHRAQKDVCVRAEWQPGEGVETYALWRHSSQVDAVAKVLLRKAERRRARS